LESGGDDSENISVYAVSRAAFVHCRPPSHLDEDRTDDDGEDSVRYTGGATAMSHLDEEDRADDDGDRVHLSLSDIGTTAVTRRQLLHNQSNYFIGTFQASSTIHELNWTDCLKASRPNPLMTGHP